MRQGSEKAVNNFQIRFGGFVLFQFFTAKIIALQISFVLSYGLYNEEFCR